MILDSNLYKNKPLGLHINPDPLTGPYTSDYNMWAVGIEPTLE